MARKVWLTITGIQKGFDQEEPVTLVTEGSYIHKNGVHYIFYSERTEEGAVIKNRLTISPGNVELRKTGAGNFNSVLVFDTEHNKNCLSVPGRPDGTGVRHEENPCITRRCTF